MRLWIFNFRELARPMLLILGDLQLALRFQCMQAFTGWRLWQQRLRIYQWIWAQAVAVSMVGPRIILKPGANFAVRPEQEAATMGITTTSAMLVVSSLPSLSLACHVQHHDSW